MKFVVDESLPPSLAVRLAEAGLDAVHVSDIDLRSAADNVVFEEAQRLRAAIVTKDLDYIEFARSRKPHGGVVIVRFTQRIRMATLIDETVKRLHAMSETDIKNNIVIFEPERTRIRGAEA